MVSFIYWLIWPTNGIILFIYLFTFRERGREEEREGEKHQCVVASCTPPTGDLAHNPGMCPDWELNWQPFGLQASTQSTEPHQPGLEAYCFNLLFPLNNILRHLSSHSFNRLCSVPTHEYHYANQFHIYRCLHCFQSSAIWNNAKINNLCIYLYALKWVFV